MLALTRKLDQRVQIGPDICITILHVRGKQVRLGIEAPRQVRVVRSELSDENGVQAIALSDLLAPLVAGSARSKPVAAKRPPVRRRPGSSNPGEHAFSAGRQPLAAKLHARRMPHAAPVAVA